jgi:hypothetical protein
MRTAIPLALLVAAGVAACGSSGTGAAVTQAPTVTVTAPVSTQAPASGTATAVTPATSTTGSQAGTTATVTTATITAPDSGGAGLTTATTAGTSPCVAGDLHLASVGPNSAPGTTVLGFTLTNTGAGACHTGGWPGVALYAAGAAAPLTTSATRSTADVLGRTPVTEIVLDPGQEASFRLVLSTNSADDVGCHTATRAQFIAPNDTAVMSVTIPDGAEYCGRATVSPLEPGATGTGQ